MKAIYLEWDDSNARYGWINKTSVKGDLTTTRIKSIGYLVDENQTHLMITNSESQYSVNDPLTIPKKAILKRRNIKTPK